MKPELIAEIGIAIPLVSALFWAALELRITARDAAKLTSLVDVVAREVAALRAEFVAMRAEHGTRLDHAERRAERQSDRCLERHSDAGE